MKKTLLTLATLAAFAAPAVAADIPRGRSAIPGMVMSPSAVPVWTGFYAGAHLGYAFGGRFDTNVPGFNMNNPAGVFGGLQGGYDYQIDRFVIGAAGDIGLAGVSRRFGPFGGQTYRGRETWNGSLRVRAGVAVQDNLLLYGTGGLAFGGLTVSETPVPTGSQSRTLTGYTIGFGGEYMFTRNIAGMVEYRYTDLSRAAYTGIAGAPRIGHEGHSVRTGVNYRF